MPIRVSFGQFLGHNKGKVRTPMLDHNELVLTLWVLASVSGIVN